MIWHPLWPSHVLASFWMWSHREGPEYISPSSGWTNPTIDPWASTNTFRIPNSTFIITLLWRDVWCHQSIHPMLVINMISWFQGSGYSVFENYSNWTFIKWLDRMLSLLWVCVHHIILSNDMISLSNNIQCSWSGNHDHRLINALVNKRLY